MVEYYDFENGLTVEEVACKKMTPKEVIGKAKQYRGFVDWNYISDMMEEPIPVLQKAWEGVYVWRNPHDKENWLFEEQYYNRKRHEIMERLPKRRTLHKEDIVLGAGYITVEAHNLIFQKLFDLPFYVQMAWKDYEGKIHINEEHVRTSVRNCHTYATPRRTGCYLINSMIEDHDFKEYDYVVDVNTGKKKKVLNEELTAITKEKMKVIKDTVAKIVFSDSRLLQMVEDELNWIFDYDYYKYDGSYLDVKNEFGEQLFGHKKNLVSRALLSKATLGAHEVGSGKSYTIPMICHLKKQRDKKENILMVLKKADFHGTVETHRRLYPEDNLLILTSENVKPHEREEMLEQMRSGEYDGIYMTSPLYDRLSVSKETDLKEQEEEIRKCRRALIDSFGNRKYTRAASETLKKLEKQKCKILQTYYDPMYACFESLGITTIIIDECHNYRRISFGEQVEGVPGSYSIGSAKSDSNLKKVHYTLKNGGAVVYLTGTPIKNSPNDLFAILKALMPDELEKCGIKTLSQWMKIFGKRDYNFKIAPDMANYREENHFLDYRNHEILKALCSYVGDFYFEKNESERPEFISETILVERSPEQKAYIEQCAERAEMVYSRQVDPTEDNLLKINIDARKCGLDICQVRKDLIGKVTYGKGTVCADKMKEIYDAFPGTTQIGFIDLGTPKAGYNLYDNLRNELVKRGIPIAEIAFIHEGTTSLKRTQLLQDLKDGKIRIMLGSTQKLGEGVNVQDHLIAIHNVDAPWNLSDLIQRRGRGDRRGNQNKTFYEYNYITEGTADSLVWQHIEIKGRFSSGFLECMTKPEEREAMLSTKVVLDCAEIKAIASGNPLVKERFEKWTEIEELKIANFNRRNELIKLEEIAKEYPKKIKQKEKFIAEVGEDIVYYGNHKHSLKLEEREAFGEELLKALSSTPEQAKEEYFKEYQGFDVVLPEKRRSSDKYVILRRTGGGTYFCKMDGDKKLGCCQRLDYILEHLPNRKEQHEKDLADLAKDFEFAKMELKKGNPYEAKLEQAVKELQEIVKNMEAA